MSLAGKYPLHSHQLLSAFPSPGTPQGPAVASHGTVAVPGGEEQIGIKPFLDRRSKLIPHNVSYARDDWQSFFAETANTCSAFAPSGAGTARAIQAERSSSGRARHRELAETPDNDGCPRQAFAMAGTVQGNCGFIESETTPSRPGKRVRLDYRLPRNP